MENTYFATLAQTMAKIEGAYAPATIRAYRENFEKFISYCSKVDACPIPAMPDTVANYVAAISDGSLKSSSIRLTVASISAIHRFNQLPDPTKDAEVTLQLRRTYRQLGRAQAQAYGINQNLLQKMLSAANLSNNKTRDIALLLLAHDSMCRRSELVSIEFEDIQNPDEPDHLKIRLRKSKTDQERIGRWLYLTDQTKQAIHEWIQESGISNGPLFPGRRSNGKNAPLGADQISRIFKRIATRAGIEPAIVEHISGHSMRVGAAQDLLSSGASLPIIMNRGRWTKVDTVMRYVEQMSSSVTTSSLELLAPT